MTCTTKHNAIPCFRTFEVKLPATITAESVMSTIIVEQQMYLQIITTRATHALPAEQKKNLLTRCMSKFCSGRSHGRFFHGCALPSSNDTIAEESLLCAIRLSTDNPHIARSRIIEVNWTRTSDVVNRVSDKVSVAARDKEPEIRSSS